MYRLNADCGFRLSAENVHLDLTEYIQLKIHNKNRLFVSSFSWIWLHVHDLRAYIVAGGEFYKVFIMISNNFFKRTS